MHNSESQKKNERRKRRAGHHWKPGEKKPEFCSYIPSEVSVGSKRPNTRLMKGDITQSASPIQTLHNKASETAPDNEPSGTRSTPEEKKF